MLATLYYSNINSSQSQEYNVEVDVSFCICRFQIMLSISVAVELWKKVKDTIMKTLLYLWRNNTYFIGQRLMEEIVSVAIRKTQLFAT